MHGTNESKKVTENRDDREEYAYTTCPMNVNGGWKGRPRTQTMMIAGIYIGGTRDAGKRWEGGRGRMMRIIDVVKRYLTWDLFNLMKR